MTKLSVGQTLESFRTRWENTKFKTMGAGTIALLLLVSVSASAQKAPKVNAPRPLEALGMSYANLKSYLGPCNKDCSKHAKEAEKGHRATFDLPPYSYTVEGGKVVEVVITADSFDGFIAEGKEAWGSPASLEYQTLQNPFGSESRLGTAHWDLPGGVTIDVRETKIPGKVLGVTTVKTVDHSTAHITQKEDPQDAAIVTITSNPAAVQANKPKVTNVLGEPRKDSVNSTGDSNKQIAQ